jgi:hypothetical protein
MTTASVLVLHTTEGSTIAGAEAAFERNNSWPHLIYDPDTGERKQYLPFSQTGRALRNMTGGVETNRRESDGLDGPDIIQVEIVGYAADTPYWDDLKRLGLAQYVIDVCRVAGIPIEFPWEYDDSDAYGLGGSVRLTNAQWLDVRGVVGHQHVPENTHWDPGDIDWLPSYVAFLLDLENQAPPTPDPVYEGECDLMGHKITVPVGPLDSNGNGWNIAALPITPTFTLASANTVLPTELSPPAYPNVPRVGVAPHGAGVKVTVEGGNPGWVYHVRVYAE